MPKYSPRAAKALAQLKRYYNDVDIFVEDTANHNMWLLVIRALLPSGIKLESVNMLGGRDAVTKACKLDQADDGRKKLYIIDGDFDFLHGRKRIPLKHLYRLRANNIENLLISEDALISVGLEHQPKKGEAQIRNDLKMSYLNLAINDLLRPLFVAYATSHSLCPSIQTTGFSVKKLINNTKSGPELNPDKVRRRIVSLYIKLSRVVGINKVRDERSRIANNEKYLPISQVASGKDYVLPLVFLKFQMACGYSRGDENFKVALARSFSPDVEPYFARRVKNIAT